MEATIYVRPHGREGEVTLTCTENATIFYGDDVNFHGTDKVASMEVILNMSNNVANITHTQITPCPTPFLRSE